MSAAIEGNRALIAREVAALRRHGWPAGRALKLVAQKVPPGPDREALAALAAALEAGRAPDAQKDPFLAVLAQGDAAGQEALLDVARSDEAVRELRLGWMQAVVLPSVLLCIALPSLFFVGAPEELMARQFGAAVPAPTVFVMEALKALRWLTPFLVAGVALLAWKFPRDRVPGLRSLVVAAALRRFLAALSAGRPEREALAAIDPQASRLHASTALRLDVYERAMLFTLEARGPAEAARALAREMEADAARSMQRVRVVGPTLGIVVAVVFVAGMTVVALASYLPIFTLAGSIR
ncbi:MAG TPA: hypothetical protein VGK67_23575 [Myxococcales bacterium]|jgi:type II secretory pathway component PulF